MKVILNDYVEHLGERGDTVQVKPGYARNYLVPKGLAYVDGPGNRKRFQQEQRNWEELDLKRRGVAEKIVSELSGVELLFERRAGEKDVLFGSVSAFDVARELQTKGFDLDKRRVILPEAIKEIGNYQVEVKVHRDVSVTLPVHVVRPGEQAVDDTVEPEAEVVTGEPESDTAAVETQVVDEPEA